jgi:hypothetical protein
MRPFAVALVVFVGVSGGGLLGLTLRGRLPSDQLREDWVGMVKLGTGLIATLSALVLGLLVASAKASYDQTNNQIIKAAADLVLLDRTLAQYGPETSEARKLLRSVGADVAEILSGTHADPLADLANPQMSARGERFSAQLRGLAPHNDGQRMLQQRAMNLDYELAQARWLILAQGQSSLPLVFVGLLVLWAAAMFAGFGLVSVNNRTNIAALLFCALSLGFTVLVIEELNRPLGGLLRIQSAPIRSALTYVGR